MSIYTCSFRAAAACTRVGTAIRDSLQRGFDRLMKSQKLLCMALIVYILLCLLLFAHHMGGALQLLILLPPSPLSVERLTLPIRDLPPSLEGLTIAHLSDIHYKHVQDIVDALPEDKMSYGNDGDSISRGEKRSQSRHHPLYARKAHLHAQLHAPIRSAMMKQQRVQDKVLAEVVRLVNQETVDLILISGDLMHGDGHAGGGGKAEEKSNHLTATGKQDRDQGDSMEPDKTRHRFARGNTGDTGADNSSDGVGAGADTNASSDRMSAEYDAFIHSFLSRLETSTRLGWKEIDSEMVVPCNPDADADADVDDDAGAGASADLAGGDTSRSNIFVVFGNHDDPRVEKARQSQSITDATNTGAKINDRHASGAEERKLSLPELLRETGIALPLLNQGVYLYSKSSPVPGTAGDDREDNDKLRHSLALFGIESISAYSTPASASSSAPSPLPSALSVLDAVPPSMPRVVLTHNPDIAETLKARRADLVVAGHTHGGQVCLPSVLSALAVGRPRRGEDRIADPMRQAKGDGGDDEVRNHSTPPAGKRGFHSAWSRGVSAPAILNWFYRHLPDDSVLQRMVPYSQKFKHFEHWEWAQGLHYLPRTDPGNGDSSENTGDNTDKENMLYVSRGLADASHRLFCHPEVTFITLGREAEN